MSQLPNSCFWCRIEGAPGPLYKRFGSQLKAVLEKTEKSNVIRDFDIYLNSGSSQTASRKSPLASSTTKDGRWEQSALTQVYLFSKSWKHWWRFLKKYFGKHMFICIWNFGLHSCACVIAHSSHTSQPDISTSKNICASVHISCVKNLTSSYTHC